MMKRLNFESLEVRRLLTQLVDINGDGDLDMLSRGVWFENADRLGNLIEHSFSNASPTESLAADLDGDGDLDIATSNGSWYENTNGRGLFGPAVELENTRRGSGELRILDISGDGDLDIVFMKPDSVVWFENTDGRGSFTKQPEITTFDAADVADIDFDGDIDILQHDADKGRMRLLSSVDNGHFESLLDLGETDGLFFVEPRFADFDGDALVDIAVGQSVRGQATAGVMVFLNEASSFSTILSLDRGAASTTSRLFDVNRDGDLDVLASPSRRDEFVLLSNDGTGGFTSRWQDAFSIPKFELLTDVGDINNDGVLDFAYDYSFSFFGTPQWFDGKLGDFHTATSPQIPEEPRLRSFVASSVFTSPVGRVIDMADFDGDGIRDVLTIASEALMWSATNLRGTVVDFRPPSTLTPNVTLAVATDFDGDGDQDIVFTDNSWNGNNSYTLELLENDGQGNFTRFLLDQVRDERSVGLVAVDIDGDGDSDIVSSHYDDSLDVVAYQNKGNRQVEQQLLAEQADWISPSITDWDGDGTKDIVVRAGRKYGWFRHLGGFEFDSIRELGRFPNDTELTDIDDDGELEFLQIKPTIAFEERIDATFQPRLEVGESDRGRVELFDLDGDGDRDVVNIGLHHITWFQRDGDNFEGPISIASAPGPRPKHLLNGHSSDFDGDGDIDVLTRFGDEWQILENRLIGDSNDDGVFDSSDLVAVMRQGKYERAGRYASFDEGDWNGDGRVDSSDLIVVLKFGHYQ